MKRFVIAFGIFALSCVALVLAALRFDQTDTLGAPGPLAITVEAGLAARDLANITLNVVVPDPGSCAVQLCRCQQMTAMTFGDPVEACPGDR